MSGGAGTRRRVAVVTGTRAEFGLLRPVMHAVERHPELDLLVVVCGMHLVGPAHTVREVEAEFDVAARVPMQREGQFGRLADARALGRGVSGVADALERLGPAWVVVLGDRIEALAGASAASVGGVGVAHLHGGDRAEGVADEAMRHAITKLAHLHLAATPESAARIERMGEEPRRIHIVGSPAIDGLDAIPALSDGAFEELGRPDAVFLMHPVGRDDADEETDAGAVLTVLERAMPGRVLAIAPNADAGREGIDRAVRGADVRRVEHLGRDRFVGLLRRVRVLVGNSSAGLIEASAVGCPVVDIGDRQAGRERPDNVVHAAGPEAVPGALRAALHIGPGPCAHPFGDGEAGPRTASLLASVDPAGLLRKRNSF